MFNTKLLKYVSDLYKHKLPLKYNTMSKLQITIQFLYIYPLFVVAISHYKFP